METAMKLVLACLVICTLLSGCTAAQRGPARPARINHVVFVKLRDPADAAAAIADCNRSLPTIPGVTAYYAGTHIDTGRGAAVTADYDVGLFIGFETAADYAVYVDHPAHTGLVDRWRSRVEWLRAYDVLDETP
jgi:hypothetical protein